MTADLSRGTSVIIARWHNTYIVPADHPAPENLKARLDGLVARELADACRSRLTPLLDPGDTSVWLIRQLHLDLAADAAPEVQTSLAQAWGEQFASQVNGILAGEEQGGVLRFPSRAAYLSQFVSDIACGQAWDKWYYQEFDSLASLTASAAIREALVREPGQASPIISLLAAQRRLDPVLNALNEHDAGKIYQSCFAGSKAGLEVDTRRWMACLLESWSSTPLSASGSVRINPYDQLRLYARAWTLVPEGASDRGLQDAIDGLLSIRGILRLLPAEAVRALLQAAATADRESVSRLLSVHGIETSHSALQMLAGDSGAADWTAHLVAVLAPEGSLAPLENSSRQKDSCLTSFAGIFLLGPSFLELKIDELIREAAQACEDSELAAPLLRHLLAIRCMGRQQALEAVSDPGLQAFADPGRAYSPSDIASLVSSADAVAVFRALAAVLAETQRISSGVWLADLEALPFSHYEAVFLRDAGNDEWLHAIVLENGIENAEAALDQSLQFVFKAVRERPQWLVLSPRLSELCTTQCLLERVPGIARLSGVDNSALEEIALDLGMETGRLKRALRSVNPDLEFLSLAGLWPGFQLPPGAELAWSFSARAVWKDFSRKLTGFSAGSPEYMFRNFLAGLGSVSPATDKLEVQLPASPLAMILRLVGAYEGSYALPWRPEREICLLAPAN